MKLKAYSSEMLEMQKTSANKKHEKALDAGDEEKAKEHLDYSDKISEELKKRVKK